MILSVKFWHLLSREFCYDIFHIACASFCFKLRDGFISFNVNLWVCGLRCTANLVFVVSCISVAPCYHNALCSLNNKSVKRTLKGGSVWDDTLYIIAYLYVRFVKLDSNFTTCSFNFLGRSKISLYYWIQKTWWC